MLSKKQLKSMMNSNNTAYTYRSSDFNGTKTFVEAVESIEFSKNPDANISKTIDSFCKVEQSISKSILFNTAKFSMHSPIYNEEAGCTYEYTFLEDSRIPNTNGIYNTLHTCNEGIIDKIKGYFGNKKDDIPNTEVQRMVDDCVKVAKSCISKYPMIKKYSSFSVKNNPSIDDFKSGKNITILTDAGTSVPESALSKITKSGGDLDKLTKDISSKIKNDCISINCDADASWFTIFIHFDKSKYKSSTPKSESISSVINIKSVTEADELYHVLSSICEKVKEQQSSKVEASVLCVNNIDEIQKRSFAESCFLIFRGGIPNPTKEVVLNESLHNTLQSTAEQIPDAIKEFESGYNKSIMEARLLLASLSKPIRCYNKQVQSQLESAMGKTRKVVLSYIMESFYKVNIAYASKADAIAECFNVEGYKNNVSMSGLVADSFNEGIFSKLGDMYRNRKNKKIDAAISDDELKKAVERVIKLAKSILGKYSSLKKYATFNVSEDSISSVPMKNFKFGEEIRILENDEDKEIPESAAEKVSKELGAFESDLRSQMEKDELVQKAHLMAYAEDHEGEWFVVHVELQRDKFARESTDIDFEEDFDDDVFVEDAEDIVLDNKAYYSSNESTMTSEYFTFSSILEDAVDEFYQSNYKADSSQFLLGLKSTEEDRTNLVAEQALTSIQDSIGAYMAPLQISWDDSAVRENQFCEDGGDWIIGSYKYFKNQKPQYLDESFDICLLKNNLDIRKYNCTLCHAESANPKNSLEVLGTITLKPIRGYFEAMDYSREQDPVLEISVQGIKNAAQQAKDKAAQKRGAIDMQKVQARWNTFVNFLQGIYKKYINNMQTRIAAGTQFMKTNYQNIKNFVPNAKGTVEWADHAKGLQNIRNIKFPNFAKQIETAANGTEVNILELQQAVDQTYNPANGKFVDAMKAKFLGGPQKITTALKGINVDAVNNFLTDNTTYQSIMDQSDQTIKLLQTNIMNKMNELNTKYEAAQKEKQAAEQQAQRQNATNQNPTAGAPKANTAAKPAAGGTTMTGQQPNQASADFSDFDEIKEFIQSYTEATPQQQVSQTQQDKAQSDNKAASTMQIKDQNGVTTRSTSKDGNDLNMQGIKALSNLSLNIQNVISSVTTAKMTAYEQMYHNYMQAMKEINNQAANAMGQQQAAPAQQQQQ